MIEITVNTRRAIVTNKELLTSGSAGIEVQFTLSEDWDGLVKLAVFRVGEEGTKVDVALDSSLHCVVPSEVLVEDGEPLFIGVYGANGTGAIIIPTIWASAGVIRPGTEPNTPATAEPTPEIWAQILNVAQSAEVTANDAYTMAANAQGYIVEKIVTDAVDDFVENTVPAAIQGIEEEGTTQVNRIGQAVVDVQAAVDQAESDAAEIIADTREEINNFEAQKSTIAQSIASMAELGTDTTLSTPGMAADAKATGDAVNNLSRQLSDVEENQIPELKSAVDTLANDGAQKNDYDFDWSAGYINSATGAIDPSVDSWRVSKPIPAIEFYSLYITTPNPIEVYAYNSDDSYFGRRSNLPANSVDYQPTNGYLSSATYCRLLTTSERADLLSAYTVQKTLVTTAEFEESIEGNNKTFTALFSEDGYLDLTDNISIGGISGLGVVELNDTRYLCTPNMIQMNGENIRLMFLKSEFSVEVCFYKPDGSWWGRYPSTAQSADTVITVPSFLQNQYYVRFMFRPVVSTNFAVSGIPKDIGIRIKNYPTEKKNINLKVLSYNLRCLRNFSNSDPDNAPLTEQEIKTCVETMANYIGGINPDLFIACEDRPWFDTTNASDISGGTKSVYEMLWKHWFPYKFDIEYGITVPRLYSKYPIIYGRRHDVTYPSGVQSVRPISTCLVYINNTPIWIIPVHATSDPSAYETDRVPYFNAIINFCADKEKVILAGDFNTDTSTPSYELQAFVDAGFSLGNHGFFGDKKTYISGEGYTMNRLDNIITKGLTLNNFIVDSDIEYSDHYPVHSAITLSV